MLNRIILMGRMTRDPDVRYTHQGTAVASFTLAVDRDFKSGGEKAADFIDCVAWRGTAEFAGKYFKKGQMAVVEGRLQIRDWTDREGARRRSAEVVVDNLYFGDSKKAASGEGQSGRVLPGVEMDKARGYYPNMPDDDDDAFAPLTEEDEEALARIGLY